MSVQYKPILWDRSKIAYDIVLLAIIGLYIFLFLRVAPDYLEPGGKANFEIQRMRAFGSCAFLLLGFVLCIGPLARLDRRFLPLLYNRRHFGVMTATVAAAHVVYVIDWYFVFSPTPSYVALVEAVFNFSGPVGVAFELFGGVALLSLLVLAVTSHDFWMSFLTPPVWKALHMSVYIAYICVVAHVAFGYLQDVTDPTFPAIVTISALLVGGLHLWSAFRSGEPEAQSAAEGWIAAGSVHDAPEGRAKIIALPGGERVAIYRRKAKLFAITNVCSHQNGPLGEGRIIDGCVTCPWHGHQFDPENGCAPAPFTDRVATYQLRRDGDALFVKATPQPLGSRTPPVEI